MPETTPEATTEPEHRCLRGHRCSASTLQDGERLPAATTRPDTVCDDCTETITAAINDLIELWSQLAGAVSDLSRRTGQKVAASRSAPININTEADALKTSIVEWLTVAAARIAEHLNIDVPQPHTTKQHRTMAAAAAILTPHIDMLLGLPEGDVVTWSANTADDAYAGESIPHDLGNGQRVYLRNVEITAMTGLQIALQLLELRRQTRKHLALTSDRDRLTIPCPGCNEIALIRTHRIIELAGGKTKDIDEIDCGNCGLTWPYERYRQLCLIWVKEDEMEREKLQTALDEATAARQLAEWLLAKRNWQLSLALDCPDVPASEFAKTVLNEPIPEPGPDELMTDRDVATLVGVADSTIRSWASRGHIERHTAADGSTLYNAHQVWEHAKTVAGGRNATTRRPATGRKATQDQQQ